MPLTISIFHTRRAPLRGGGGGGPSGKDVELDRHPARRRRNVYVLLGALLLLGLGFISTFGLSYAFRRRDDPLNFHNYHKRSSRMPTDGQVTTTASLRKSGEWYTTSNLKETKNIFRYGNLTLDFGPWTKSKKDIDIIIDTTIIHQPIEGFGAAITDSSAYLLLKLKKENEAMYYRVLKSMFNARTGMPIVRVPLGSSDFALEPYSYLMNMVPLTRYQAMVKAGNTSQILAKVNLGDAKKYILPVLKDAIKIRPSLRVLFTPWSPPAMFKDNGDLAGGSLIKGYENILAKYYLHSLKAYQAAGIKVWGMTIQNEPSWAPPYPSCLMSVAQQAKVAKAIRSLLKYSTTYKSLRNLVLLGHDNNFDKVDDAIALSKAAGSALDGYAFHCYKGDARDMGRLADSLQAQKLSGRGVYMSECSGTYSRSSDRWTSQFWWLENLFLPALKTDARAALTWNVALDPKFGPRLKTAICNNCVGPLTIKLPTTLSGSPSVTVGPQFLNLNHLNVVSQDMTRLGGGSAYRVGSWWGAPEDRQVSESNFACIDFVAFAAPLEGDSLPTPKRGDAASQGPATKRMGLIVVNQCAWTVWLRLAVDGIPSRYKARPGITSVVWLDR